MKKLVCFFLFFATLIGFALASPLSGDQYEVKVLIEKMYSIDSNSFEFGYFGGKYDRKKQAALHAEFFSRELRSSVKDVTGVDGAGWVRHPSSDEYQLSGEGGPPPTKNPKIQPPTFKGSSASVDVYPDNGRTIYFLTKTADGWRIVNTASYNVWPTRQDGTCWEPFYLVKPTPDQLALETKECIKYRKSESGIK